MIKQIDGYKIFMNQMLGQGSYGAVYIGVSQKDDSKVAIKILKKSNSKQLIMKSILMIISRLRSSLKSKSCSV